jgi:hypothetical protein
LSTGVTPTSSPAHVTAGQRDLDRVVGWVRRWEVESRGIGACGARLAPDLEAQLLHRRQPPQRIDRRGDRLDHRDARGDQMEPALVELATIKTTESAAQHRPHRRRIGRRAGARMRALERSRGRSRPRRAASEREGADASPTGPPSRTTSSARAAGAQRPGPAGGGIREAAADKLRGRARRADEVARPAVDLGGASASRPPGRLALSASEEG